MQLGPVRYVVGFAAHLFMEPSNNTVTRLADTKSVEDQR